MEDDRNGRKEEKGVRRGSVAKGKSFCKVWEVGRSYFCFCKFVGF